MKIKCPQCQKIFDIPDIYVGKEIKCLKCNHPFIVNSSVNEQKGKIMMRPFPFILLGVVVVLLVGGFLYRFQFGQFFGLSQKNAVGSDSNNISSTKNTDLVNSIVKQPIEQSVKVEKKTEKIEKPAQVLKADVNAISSGSDTVESKEAVPVLKPVIDNNTTHSTEDFKSLPALYSVIDKSYFVDSIIWLNWSLCLELNALNISMGKPPEKDINQYLTKKEDVIEMIYKINSSDDPLLFAYKKEISDLIQSFDFVFLKRKESINKDMLPIQFVSLKDKPVIMIGSICSDTVFNNVNTLLNTPKKRASAFTQKEVLSGLLKKDLFHSIRNIPFEYIGLVYIYGNKNFISDKSHSWPESLCIIIPLKDYSSFMKRELSQEEFLKKCFVFLKSEGANFVKVELTLD